MTQKKRRSPKGPPANAAKWIEDFHQGKHSGLTPTPANATSIWDTSYIPDRYIPVTLEVIAATGKRLGIAIPSSLANQLVIQNGGYIVSCDEYPFETNSIRWTNAIVDGIDPVDSWKRASDDHWFDSVNDVEGLHLLIRIAAHSESQLCLDYRKSGQNGLPGITYVEVCMNPTVVRVLTDSVDEFLDALIVSRPSN